MYEKYWLVPVKKVVLMINGQMWHPSLKQGKDAGCMNAER